MTEMPDRLSCDECREEGKNIIHFSYSQYLDEAPDGPWFWDIMNHDKTSKFQWPESFDTKPKAVAFVQKLLDDAEAEVKQGDDVV